MDWKLKNVGRKITSPSVVRIEHCRQRHPQDEQEHDKKATLDFKWMLGVCYGNSLVRGVKAEDKTCDAHRGNTELTVNPFDELSVRKIKYDDFVCQLLELQGYLDEKLRRYEKPRTIDSFLLSEVK